MIKFIVAFFLILSVAFGFTLYIGYYLSKPPINNEEPVLFEQQNEQGVWGVVDKDGHIIVPFNYDHIDLYGDLIHVVNFGDHASDNIEGVFNQYGEWLIPFEYASIDIKDKALFIVAVKNHKLNRLFYGVINDKNKTIIPIDYDYISYDKSYERFIVSKEGKKGIINKQGQLLLEPTYEVLTAVSMWGGSPKFEIRKDEKYGLINIESGKTVIPTVYDFLFFTGTEYSEVYKTSLLIAVKDKKFGVITDNNQIVIPLDYDGMVDQSLNIALENYKEVLSVYVKKNTQEKIEFKHLSIDLYDKNIEEKPISTVYSVPVDITQFNLSNELDGLYLPEKYDSISKVFTGVNQRELNDLIIPSFTLIGDQATIALDVFSTVYAPPKYFKLASYPIKITANSFIILFSSQSDSDNKRFELSFEKGDSDQWLCKECNKINIPSVWRKKTIY